MGEDLQLELDRLKIQLSAMERELVDMGAQETDLDWLFEKLTDVQTSEDLGTQGHDIQKRIQDLLTKKP